MIRRGKRGGKSFTLYCNIQSLSIIFVSADDERRRLNDLMMVFMLMKYLVLHSSFG